MVTWCSRTLLLSLLLLLFPKKTKLEGKILSLHFSAGRNSVAIGLLLSLLSSSSSCVSQNIRCHIVSRCQKEAELVLLSLSRTDRGRGGEEFFEEVHA